MNKIFIVVLALLGLGVIGKILLIALVKLGVVFSFGLNVALIALAAILGAGLIKSLFRTKKD